MIFPAAVSGVTLIREAGRINMASSLPGERDPGVNQRLRRNYYMKDVE